MLFAGRPLPHPPSIIAMAPAKRKTPQTQAGAKKTQKKGKGKAKPTVQVPIDEAFSDDGPCTILRQRYLTDTT